MNSRFLSISLLILTTMGCNEDEARTARRSQDTSSVDSKCQKDRAERGKKLYVVNGERADEKTYPAVKYILIGEKQALCSGTFVSDQVYITAAHCTVNSLDEEFKPDQIKVYDSREVDRDNTQGIKAIKFYRHPLASKDPDKMGYDLAVVVFPKGTSADYLPLGNVGLEEDDDITLVGFGPSAKKKTDNEKRFGTSNITSLTNDKTLAISELDDKRAYTTEGDSGGAVIENQFLKGLVSGIVSEEKNAFVNLIHPYNLKVLRNWVEQYDLKICGLDGACDEEEANLKTDEDDDDEKDEEDSKYRRKEASCDAS